MSLGISRLAIVVVTTLFTSLTFTGCGKAQGFTDCSGIECQPGQYCFAPGVCESGCTSDANCTEDQDCADEGSGFDGEGVCRDSDDEPSGEGEGEGEGEGNALESCIAACEHFQGCGMSAGDTAQCRNDCPDLSENQQLAVGGCAEGSCNDALNCLEFDCFSADDCGLDEQCLGSSCL